MPVVYSTPDFPWQYGANPANQAYSTQLNYGQMYREVMKVNPNVDSGYAGRLINNRYRVLIDRRRWYGTKVRGNLFVPYVQYSGTCTVTQGLNTVTGSGTSWNTSLIGLQFRQSFANPWQTIVAVNPLTQTLTLDTLYPGQTFTGAYQIAEVYVTMGANIKHFKWAVNQLYGWPIKVNVAVEYLNARDTWRQALGWTTVWATRPPTPDGQTVVEMWPTPYANQSMSFEAWIQPPNLVKETDSVMAWIRPDIIIAGAQADALMHKPKLNSYIDPASAMTVAAAKEKYFEAEIASMENVDEGLDQQDVTWDYGQEADDDGRGSFFAQTHDVN